MSVSHASSRGQLVISGLSWSTPDGHSLFSHLDLAFGAERTGLVGRNGVGKSTLLKLIAGDLPPQAGSIACGGRLGVLRQDVQVAVDATIADLFDIAPALRVLRRAAAGEADIAELADADWTLEARLAAALAGVGLTADADTHLASLSGGQRTRAALAALVFAEPDFILLDEPTNNLDRAGRQRVLELLEGWRGGALVVSHDRELLETMDVIVELTALGAGRYAGGWSMYREMKALELAAARHDLADAERRVAEVDRGAQATLERKAHKDAAGKRKGARGDLPRIVLGGMKRRAENTSGANARLAERRRLDALEAAANARRRIEVLEPLTVVLPSTGLAASKTVVRVDRVTAGYDANRPIIENLSFSIIGPERVAIGGPNGSGKTTLLALLTGALAPWSGSVEVAVPFALLDQRVSLLDAKASIRDNFRRLNPGSDENGCRAALARFLFRADAALQVAGTLSGGQLLRAGLACVVGGARPPSLLLLDEPTNHLDIDSIAAVEAGLRAYDGALLVVSHDEAFLDAIGIERPIELGASM